MKSYMIRLTSGMTIKENCIKHNKKKFGLKIMSNISKILSDEIVSINGLTENIEINDRNLETQ